MDLYDEVAAGPHRDLLRVFNRVDDYLEEVWDGTLLGWFTDHGLDHSQRVADYALQLASVVPLPAGVELTPLERAILWLSAKLHDIGMQRSNRPLGELTAMDAKTVRDEHPAKSATAILEDADKLGFAARDQPLVEIISAIAKSHGTEFYRESVEALGLYRYVRDERVRGSLLASILLMADELDLNHVRQAKPIRGTGLNDITRAHNLKHSRVLFCRFGLETGSEVRIELVVTRPQDADERVEAAIENWIVDKLRRQIAFVSSEFVAGFNNHASFSRNIDITREVALVPREEDPVPEAVIRVIERDNARAELINHGVALEQCLEHLMARENVIIEGRFEDGVRDVDGREDLLRAVLARAESQGALVLHSERMVRSGAASTYRDVKAEFRDMLPIIGPMREAWRIESVVEHLRKSGQRVVVAVSSIDLLAQRQIDNMQHTFDAARQLDVDVTAIVTLKPAKAMSLSGNRVRPAAVNRRDAESYLSRYTNRGSAAALAASGLSYAYFKEFVQQTLVQLSEGDQRG